MNILPIIFLVISVILLVSIITLSWVLFKKKRKKKPSPYVTFGIFLIAISLAFRDRLIVGYSFIGIGVFLAIIDVFRGILGKKQNLRENKGQEPERKEILPDGRPALCDRAYSYGHCIKQGPEGYSNETQKAAGI